MAKFRGIQIRDGAITSTHLVTGITVNGITLSGSAANQHTFAVLNSVGLEGTAGSYNLDSFLIKSGGTVSGSLTVTGSLTVSGGVVVPSGTTLLIGPALSGTDLIQALSGIDAGVTATKLIQLTNTSTVTGHTHTTSSLSIKEEHMLTKVATSGTDYITLDFGTASNLSLPTGNGAVSSDIEAFINGQLLEYNESVGFSLSGSDVKFNPAISGDHLAVIWRALGSSGGGGGGADENEFTVGTTSLQSGVNASVEFTTANVQEMARWIQFTTQGMMPVSHYSEWIVKGKNLALDIIKYSDNAYTPNANFGLHSKLNGLLATGSYVSGTTASTHWFSQFVGVCTAWIWRSKYLLNINGGDNRGLYDPETWTYIYDALDDFVNPATLSTTGNAGVLRLTDASYNAKHGQQPYVHLADYVRFGVYGMDLLQPNVYLTSHVIRLAKDFTGVSGTPTHYVTPKDETYFTVTNASPGAAYGLGLFYNGESNSTFSGLVGIIGSKNAYRSSSSTVDRNFVRVWLVPEPATKAQYRIDNNSPGYSLAHQEACQPMRRAATQLLEVLRSSGSYDYNQYFAHAADNIEYNKLPEYIAQLVNYPSWSGACWNNGYNPTQLPVTTTNDSLYTKRSYSGYEVFQGEDPTQSPIYSAPILDDGTTSVSIGNGVIDGYIGDVVVTFN